MSGGKDELPDALGRYRVMRRLGKGGMAEVFLAKTTGAEGIEKILVIKRVLPSFARSEHFVSMFVDEAKVATRLNHPNIVQVYAFERVDGEFLLAMEFVDGVDLGRLMSACKRTGEPLPHGLAAFIVSEVAKGLDYAHKRKDSNGDPMEIVHRDVSPQNVLLAYDGIVKVADFGIAKARMVSEETGIIKGKFSYMSPEQASGQPVDRRSDVYSLGVLLGELLMGRSMYPGQQGMEVLNMVREARTTYPRDVNPEVPEALDRIVRRALHPDPEQRYQTARSFASALGQHLHMQPVMWDGEALEQLLARVVPRQKTSPGERAPRRGMTFHGETINAGSMAGEMELRERRRVVVVAGRVRDTSTLTHPGESPGVGEAAARVLSDIGYKNDAVLSWEDGAARTKFRFVIGLGRTTPQDALRGVWLAFDVLDALNGLSADLFAPVTAALGVSRGMVTTARDSTGRLLRYTPVEGVLAVADALAARGIAGEVAASGEVHRLVRRDFRFDDDVRIVHLDNEAMAIEGPSAPSTLKAYRVMGQRSREERAEDARHGETIEIVGRGAELAAIRRLYQNAVTSGRSVFAAITGDLGIGKSALVRAAIDTLDPLPGILTNECAFGTSDIPFASLAELIRDIFFIGDDVPLEEVKKQVGEAIDTLTADKQSRDVVKEGVFTLLGHVSAAPTEGDLEDRTRAVMQAVQVLIRSLAAMGPLVVWVDSLQWADSASLSLLRMMIQGTYESPCLVLMGSRPDERVMNVFRGIPVIELEELHGEEREEVVRRSFEGAEVPKDVVQAIVQRAGGNPFHIAELADALLERGSVRIEHDADGVARVVREPGTPIALPSSLEGVVAARLDELDDRDRRTLRWLAVAGSGFDEEHLSYLAGQDLTRSLARLVERGFVARRHTGAFVFNSGVVRQVAYEGTEIADRQRMHQRVADHLARTDAAPARLAHHLEHANQPDKAAVAYLDAAEAARGAYANSDALRLFAKALELLGNDEDDLEARFTAHRGRERILRFLGRRDDQKRELEAMRVLSEQGLAPALRVLTLNRAARFELDQGDFDEAGAHLDEARRIAGASGDRKGELDTLRMLAELGRDRGDSEGALAICDQALTRAGLHPDFLAARGSVLAQKAVLLQRLGRADEALEANAESVVIFRRLGLKRHEAVSLDGMAGALSQLGNLQDAISLARASLHLDRETGDRLRVGRKLMLLAHCYDSLGEEEKAESFMKRAREALHAVNDSTGRAEGLCVMINMHLRRDEVEEARKISQSLAPLIDSAEHYAATLGRLMLGRVQLRSRDAAAVDSLETARALAHEYGFAGVEVGALIGLAFLRAKQGAVEEGRLQLVEARERMGGLTFHDREQLFAALIEGFELVDDEPAARGVRAEAAGMVRERAEKLRVARVRDAYLSRADVQVILDGPDG